MGTRNHRRAVAPLVDSKHPPDHHEHPWYLPALVEVVWVDACSENGWGGIEDISSQDLPVCHSTGYLVKDLESHVAIMQTMSPENGIGSDCTYIPRLMIRSLRVLKPWRKYES